MFHRAGFSTLLSFTLLVQAAAGAPAEIPSTRHEVAGLEAGVEILVDRWGVPHIYAEKLYDVFFGQGFNAAANLALHRKLL